jgi:hypothetical protein
MNAPNLIELKRAQVGETQSADLNDKVTFLTLWIGLVWEPIRDVSRFKALLAKHAFAEKNAAR